MNEKKEIILTTINAKWIHPSLALRLLKANLDSLENSCEIYEFALRQPLQEKLDTLHAVFTNENCARILGISVSIWNHLATIELLKELEKIWAHGIKPIIVLGGPEVSHLPRDAQIFCYADYVICGEGETAFRKLCETILEKPHEQVSQKKTQFIEAEPVNPEEIKSAYHLYTDEDLERKLIYVEASRGCLFNCEFCLSAAEKNKKVREFPISSFLDEMNTLIHRGVKTFKFLDRSFNVNIKRTLTIIEFFLEKIKENKESGNHIVVHFEMVPSIFPSELLEVLSRFPKDSLRLEIGIQTLNKEVAARIGRSINPDKELETLRFLREKTNAIIHADLIAGLPGEDISSFGNGFNRLWSALCVNEKAGYSARTEIQLGILKQLPGALISRHNEPYIMFYSSFPPYEVEKTSSMSENDLKRIKNFARFWELIVNRGLIEVSQAPIFERFMALAEDLFAHFGRNWGIDKTELKAKIPL